MLVDTNFSSIPICKYLMNKGYKVFVIGGKKDDFMAKSFNNYIDADYSSVVELKNIIQRYNIDYIVPGCNDLSYEVCSEFSDKYFSRNIDGSKTINQLFNKKEFRDFSIKNKIPVPQTYSIEYIKKEKFFHPLIVKPVDSFSGKGITHIKSFSDEKEIEYAVNLAKENSKNEEYVIEDFVSGDLYSHSAFIEDKKVIKDFFVKEYCSVNSFVVDTSFVCFEFDEYIKKKIRENIEKISNVLGLSDGLIHTQFIFNKDIDKYWLIEITRRCPGDLYSKLIEYSTGFPYASTYASYFIDQKLLNKSNQSFNISKKFFVRHTLTQNDSRIFNSLTFKKPLMIKEYISIASNGDFLQPSPKGRIGIFFAYCDNKEEQKILVEDLIKNNLYEINYFD